MVDTISVAIPHETVNDESVRILLWSVASGSHVEKEQLICEVETSKAIMEIHAPAAGTVKYLAALGDEVPVGSVICEIIPSSLKQESSRPQPAPDLVTAHAAAAPPQTQLPASRLTPLARKLAAEHGIALSAFPPDTLVRSIDVLRKAGKVAAEVEVPVEAKIPMERPSPKNGSGSPKVENQPENPPVAGVPIEWGDLPRRKIVERRILGNGRAGCIQSSVSLMCRATKIRARIDKLGLSAVGIGALIIFEVSRLLRKHPMFNAVHSRGRIGQYSEVNIGWAIDGGEGLVVPVIRNTDQKSLREIAALMEKHIEDYVGKSLDPSDFLGGTFTISDLSGGGISYFQPLISEGQSAILGIGSDLTAENFEAPLYLTLAFDHQVTEGRRAAQFLREISERLVSHSEVEAATPTTLADSPDHGSFCVLCQRGASDVAKLGAVLVRSDFPPGSVCSTCLGGF
jgi:pyruvate/2-oxoglutarate dehydrogenase complex dihydrolipoamide acyltransferase (E2) component